MRPSDARPACACRASVPSPPLHNPGVSADPVLSSGSFSLPVHPGTRKSEKTEMRESKVNSLQPCSGSSTQRQVPGCALPRGATTGAPLHTDPAAAVPGTEVATALPEVIAPSNQPGWEGSCFRVKQRLARQRLFPNTCFEYRCGKVSHKCAVLLPGAEVHRTGRNCCCKGGEQSEAAALEMGSYSCLEAGGVSFTELFCRPCSTFPAVPLSVTWR